MAARVFSELFGSEPLGMDATPESHVGCIGPLSKGISRGQYGGQLEAFCTSYIRHLTKRISPAAVTAGPSASTTWRDLAAFAVALLPKGNPFSPDSLAPFRIAASARLRYCLTENVGARTISTFFGLISGIHSCSGNASGRTAEKDGL